jgi:RHS repeat-associated protein
MRKLCYYSAAAVVNVATALTYAPMSNLLTAMTHGNGLITTAGYDLDYRLSSLTLKDGATNVSALAYAYTDGMNLTGITDGVTAANSNTLGYSLANRLNAASGAWGTNSFTYDGVGNRLTDVTSTKNRQASYGATNNRLTSITENAAAFRSYTYDNAGNTITETRPGESFVYTYNKRNRLTGVTRNTVSYATYGYNALEQLTTRTTTAAGGPVGQVAYTYDLDGHLITEATASSGVKTREYIWLPSNDNSPVDLPLAVIDVATNTISYVHADHLGRPIRMTSPTKTTVWAATWKPWGEVQTLSGTTTNNLRYPGQYFQIETGLHYNHHRMYDPVTGRYTQADPLRFVDGPSVYAYAKNSPFMRLDRTGRQEEGSLYEEQFMEELREERELFEREQQIWERMNDDYYSQQREVIERERSCRIGDELEALGGGKPRIQPSPKGASQFIFPNGTVLRFDLQPNQYLNRGPHINLQNVPNSPDPNIHIPLK